MQPERDYWPLIEKARQASMKKGLLRKLMGKASGAIDLDRFEASMRDQLRTLSPEQIVKYRLWFDEQLRRAYTWDLWGAAYVMSGGCSDDGFEYFRAWLIAQGQETFERVVSDPSQVVTLDVNDPPFDCEFEGLSYVPADIYEELTKGDFYEALDAIQPAQRAEPMGTPFDEDTVHERFPEIAKKWGNA